MFTPISLRNAKHSVLTQISLNSQYPKVILQLNIWFVKGIRIGQLNAAHLALLFEINNAILLKRSFNMRSFIKSK